MVSDRTQSVCESCWGETQPGRVPTRIVEEFREDGVCYRCGVVNRSGIYTRLDDAEMARWRARQFHECETDSWSRWPCRTLDDGRTLAFEPLLFNCVRIHVVRDVHDMGSMEIYDYQDLLPALRAFLEWDGTGEPVGWYRHRPSDRRRPEGDPTREHVEP